MRLPRVRITVRRVAVVAWFALALAWYDRLSVTVRDGDYTLSLRVESASRSPIQAVSCQAFVRESDAATALGRGLPPEATDWRSAADPFTGEPFSLQLPFTTRLSPFGRTVDHFQHRALAVLVTYRDGRRDGEVVPIPHHDVGRSVTAVFP